MFTQCLKKNSTQTEQKIRILKCMLFSGPESYHGHEGSKRKVSMTNLKSQSRDVWGGGARMTA